MNNQIIAQTLYFKAFYCTRRGKGRKGKTGRLPSESVGKRGEKNIFLTIYFILFSECRA